MRLYCVITVAKVKLALLTHFSHCYQFGQSSSVLRDVGWYFSFLLAHLAHSHKVSFRDWSLSSVGVVNN